VHFIYAYCTVFNERINDDDDDDDNYNDEFRKKWRGYTPTLNAVGNLDKVFV